MAGRGKNGRKRKKSYIVRIGAAITVLTILFVLHCMRMYQEKKQAEALAEEWRNRENQEFIQPVKDVIEFGGKTYRRNTYIKAILCMGIDRPEEMTETKVAGSGGQADGIFLVAQDTARDSVKVLMIPRDTMTEITLTDLRGNVLGKDIQHLTLAYAYGDGKEKSLQYMEEAVSGLCGGLHIDGCMAVGMGALPAVNDMAGGVEVTIEEKELEQADEAFVFGETITLKGKQAERFIRYRNIKEAQTAIKRMNRHKAYLQGLAKAAKEAAEKEGGFAAKLLEAVKPYMVTDMAKDEYLDMIMAFLNSSQDLTDEDMLMLPGEAVETDLFDEYHPYEEESLQLILDLFYRPEE